jgi:hypothetical protein
LDNAGAAEDESFNSQTGCKEVMTSTVIPEVTTWDALKFAFRDSEEGRNQKLCISIHLHKILVIMKLREI